MEDKLEENYREELEKLLLAKDYRTLRKKMEDMNVVDIAFAMDEMDDEDSLKLFRILPKDMAADVRHHILLITLWRMMRLTFLRKCLPT